jgi:hypothetical protein
MYHDVTRSASDEGAAEPPTESDDGGGNPRKERVLHTRVPAVLERELKRFADNLRVPVSNLVRTILEDAVTVADAATENVKERLRKAARHLEKEREKIKRRMEHDPLEGVIAFQDVVLAVPAACAKCSKELARGAHAHMGIGETAVQGTHPEGIHPRRFVCTDCLPRA